MFQNFDWSNINMTELMSNWRIYLGLLLAVLSVISFTKRIIKLAIFLVIVAIILVFAGIIDVGTLPVSLN